MQQNTSIVTSLFILFEIYEDSGDNLETVKMPQEWPFKIVHNFLDDTNLTIDVDKCVKNLIDMTWWHDYKKDAIKMWKFCNVTV